MTTPSGQSPLDLMQRIFEQAMELPEVERAAFIRSACGGDEKLRRELSVMVEQEASTPELINPVVRRPMDSAQRLIGTGLGPYELRGILGEGGFGVVYRALQTEPVRREVAVKVIKPGMDSRAVIARFEAERQALAMMDHPCIAKVLDGGVVPDGHALAGRPYFTMEFVRGEAITHFCDRHQLGLDERLRLFARVCGGLQHAHQKGVVHRDIKPSNVLVEYHDSECVPKIIDFGVAKALHRPLTTHSVFTQHGQLIGSPEYMSPEQAEMTSLDIDTRSDIYSLGVLLYELLTGSLPFESRTLRAKAHAEIARYLRETDPPKPSTRISTVVERTGDPETATRIARDRRLDARSLPRRLRGDLDWIVMRALEKDRARRYQTAESFARDLQCFLGGEPVDAGPPSRVYRARKLLRRHRVPVSIALVVIASLVAGGGVALWQAVVAERARVRAVASEQQSRALANKMLREFNDQIVPLAGATAARSVVISAATTHLAAMEVAAASDPLLMLETARGYDELGDILGGLRSPNLGDLPAAANAYAAARLLREEAATAGASRPSIEFALAASDLRSGDLSREQERLDAADQFYRSGLARLEIPGVRDAATGVEFALLRSRCLIGLSNVIARRRSDDQRERDALLANAERQIRPVYASQPTSALGGELGRVLHTQGESAFFDGRPAAALGPLQEAIVVRSELFRRAPTNALHRRGLAATLTLLGLTHSTLGDEASAEESLTAACRHLGFLMEADPDDARSRRNYAQAKESLASAMIKNNPAGAFVHATDAVSALLALGDPDSDARIARQLSFLYLLRGEALMSLSRLAEAATDLSASFRFAVDSIERGLADSAVVGVLTSVTQLRLDAARLLMAEGVEGVDQIVKELADDLGDASESLSLILGGSAAMQSLRAAHVHALRIGQSSAVLRQ